MIGVANSLSKFSFHTRHLPPNVGVSFDLHKIQGLVCQYISQDSGAGKRQLGPLLFIMFGGLTAGRTITDTNGNTTYFTVVSNDGNTIQIKSNTAHWECIDMIYTSD